jgi:hypothetical protein
MSGLGPGSGLAGPWLSATMYMAVHFQAQFVVTEGLPRFAHRAGSRDAASVGFVS